MLENDSDDRYITQSTLKELNIGIHVRYEYYSQALTDLLKPDPPAVILIAYNTAPTNGLEIVNEFRTKAHFKYIPIVLLIEDLRKADIRRYYEAGVSTVIKKPSNEKDTREKIDTFFKYWFEVAEL